MWPFLGISQAQMHVEVHWGLCLVLRQHTKLIMSISGNEVSGLFISMYRHTHPSMMHANGPKMRVRPSEEFTFQFRIFEQQFRT